MSSVEEVVKQVGELRGRLEKSLEEIVKGIGEYRKKVEVLEGRIRELEKALERERRMRRLMFKALALGYRRKTDDEEEESIRRRREVRARRVEDIRKRLEELKKRFAEKRAETPRPEAKTSESSVATDERAEMVRKLMKGEISVHEAAKIAMEKGW
ncbi:MAG: hypothetical protein QXU26_04220 [Thermofilaceae archaeon]